MQKKNQSDPLYIISTTSLCGRTMTISPVATFKCTKSTVVFREEYSKNDTYKLLGLDSIKCLVVRLIERFGCMPKYIWVCEMHENKRSPKYRKGRIYVKED